MRISEMFASFLESMAKQMRSGECGMTDEEMEEMFHHCKALMNGMVTKQEACDEILHISRATFDRYVRNGKLPKGKSRSGSHELYWSKEELNEFKREQNE